jgi:hypothetical protein
MINQPPVPSNYPYPDDEIYNSIDLPPGKFYYNRIKGIYIIITSKIQQDVHKETTKR